MIDYINPSRLSAGFVAVLVGYTGSVAIILQAAESVGASSEQTNSWLWALGIGMAISSIGLSLKYKAPVLTAWSTPGAAFLAGGISGASIEEVIGAFLFSSGLMVVVGFSGWFARMIKYIPRSLASAMLAGVLLDFCLNAFTALQSSFLLVGTMLLTYLVCRKVMPRYTIPLVLLAGMGVAALFGDLHLATLEWDFTQPVWIAPAFSIQAIVGIGLPLFVITMASQNIPGIATLQANGYRLPVSPLIGWTGVTGLLFAPFGGFAYNLAAITAAICQGAEADVNPNKRYIAVLWAGFFYFLTGVFGATVVALFAVFPRELVFAIAGLALLNTVGSALADALADADERDSSLLVFLITASGISLLGIGAAFWGLLIGGVVWFFRRT